MKLARCLLLLLGWPCLGQASFWEGQLGFEYTHYPQQASREEADYNNNISVAFSMQRAETWNNGRTVLDVNLYGRVDQNDDNRTHADVRDLLLTVAGDSLELRLGVGRVFWGVTESSHRVDIINQSDFTEGVDGEDKLGQPLVALGWTSPFGVVEGYVLPLFRHQRYPSNEGRPAFPFPIAASDAMFASRDEEAHVDYAARWNHYLGPLDFAVSWFKGTARDPRFLPCFGRGTGRPGTENGPNCDPESTIPDPGPLGNALISLGLGPDVDALFAAALEDIVLVPTYDQVEQFGLELQLNQGNLASKFEGTLRRQLGARQTAFTAGFEYTFSTVFRSDVDVSFLSEYLYSDADERFVSFFDDDLFVGTRIALNDVQSTAFLGGVIYDLNLGSRVYAAELSRRIGASFLLELEMLILDRTPQDDPAFVLETEDLMRLTFSAFF